MSLTDRVLELIDVQVRGGFDDRGRVIEIFLTERYRPGELSRAEVEAAVDAAIRARDVAKETWPAVTDCDRLDDAFRALDGKHVIALQNAGFTQSDGHDDFLAALARARDPEAILGYCFYHGQDLERAVRGQGLRLAFGPADSKDEKVGGLAVGRLVAQELERAGLRVVWDGTFKTRIHLPEIVWQRR